MKTILQDKDQWSSDMKVRMKKRSYFTPFYNAFLYLVETWCIPVKSIIK